MNLILNTTIALSLHVEHALVGGIENIRIARSVFALLQDRFDFSPPLLANVRERFFEKSNPDGGWSDPEETAWIISVISWVYRENHKIVKKAVTWLDNVRHHSGGWGRHPRDQVRIPTTALVITLVPGVATDADRKWVRQAWERDLNSPVHLSYKGGFYLLTVDNQNKKQIDPLVLRTIEYLAEDQNDDGGFGPWRNHPIGSDPWSTGVVLWGLSKWIDQVNPEVIEKALAWLEKTQLPSGYWPYHFLDEGTSYALIGAVAASRALESRK